MFNSITIEKCLFSIDQSTLDMFYSLAEEMKHYFYLVEEGEFNRENTIFIAFNIWLLLLPDNRLITKSNDRILYYSSAYVLFDLLTQNNTFKTVKKKKDTSLKLFFLAALCLARNLSARSYEVIQKHEIAHLRTKYTTEKYLNAPYENNIEDFLQDQALYVKAVMQEITSNTFKRMIKQGLDEANMLYANFKCL